MSERGSSLGLYPGFLRKVRKVTFTVLIMEEELFTFLRSLCVSAFCSGFLYRSCPVSRRVWVYSGGLLTPGILGGSHILELKMSNASYVTEIQNVEVYEDLRRRDVGISQQ